MVHKKQYFFYEIDIPSHRGARSWGAIEREEHRGPGVCDGTRGRGRGEDDEDPKSSFDSRMQVKYGVVPPTTMAMGHEPARVEGNSISLIQF